MYFFNTVLASMIAQYKNYFTSKSIYLSLFIWPLIMFFNTYFSYKVFPSSMLIEKVGLSTTEELYVFLIIGFTGLMFFWTSVQSAWINSMMMRQSGVLELIYLSPASRFGILLGNSISSLVGSVWMLVIFSIFSFLFFLDLTQINYFSLLISLVILLIMSISWGVFMNSLFMATRDGSLFFTIMETPMEIFSGVKIPYSSLPLWAKGIGSIFPLTYVIELLRNSIIYQSKLFDMSRTLFNTTVILIILTSFTISILIASEKKTKQDGSAILF